MPAGPERLARYVRARREELGLSQGDVSARGGPSDTTLSKIEAGTGGLSRASVSKLDTALAWARGSARRVLDGGEPEPAAGAQAVDLEPAAGPRPQDLSYDELWKRWAKLLAESLVLELEYASRRNLEPAAARDELWSAFIMAREGRQWSPPWEQEAGEGA